MTHNYPVTVGGQELDGVQAATHRVRPCSLEWMILRDLPTVAAIERLSFEDPWSADEIHWLLKNLRVIGLVAKRDEAVVGFVIYELHKESLEILDLAVHPDSRGLGIGSDILQRLKWKIGRGRRRQITITVEESSLDLQLWLRRQQFRCVETLRGFFENGDDAYRFVFDKKA